jgi:amino acid transporter
MVYLGTVFWASVLCLTGKYGDLFDFVVIIVLIFYILTILGIFILRRKCQMPKDRIELLDIRFTGAFTLSPVQSVSPYCTPNK